MAVLQFLGPGKPLLDSEGNPLINGTVHFKQLGTDTPFTTFKNSNLIASSVNDQPLTLDSAGRGSAWLNGNCDVEIYNAAGDLVDSEEAINPDDIATTTTPFLVPNGSFEDDSNGDGTPDGWTLTGQSGSTNGLDTTDSKDGVNSFKFTSIGTGGGDLVTTQFFPVTEAGNLIVQFSLKSSVADVRNIVRIEWYDKNQVVLSTTDMYDEATANPTSFLQKTFRLVAPANARLAKLRLIGCDPSDATAGSTWFDNIRSYYELSINRTVSVKLDLDAATDGTDVSALIQEAIDSFGAIDGEVPPNAATTKGGALAGGMIHLDGDDWGLATEIQVPNYIHIKGNGRGNTVVRPLTEGMNCFRFYGLQSSLGLLSVEDTNSVGDVVSGEITAISKSDPVVLTATNTFKAGERVWVQLVNGMEEMNFVYGVVDNPTGADFELKGVDSTLFTTFTSSPNATAAKHVSGATLAQIDELNNTVRKDVTFNLFYDMEFRFLSEGITLFPGPGGAQTGVGDSGMWYHTFRTVHFRGCRRDLFFGEGTSAGHSGCNRNWGIGCRFGQGGTNTGIEIQAGDTNRFWGTSLEGITTVGAGPNVQAIGIRIWNKGPIHGVESHHNRFTDTEFEAVDVDMFNQHPKTQMDGGWNGEDIVGTQPVGYENEIGGISHKYWGGVFHASQLLVEGADGILLTQRGESGKHDAGDDSTNMGNSRRDLQPWTTNKWQGDILYNRTKGDYGRIASSTGNSAPATMVGKGSGTTTATTTDKLVDSGADFVTAGVQVGDRVQNLTDVTETTVAAVDSATQLEVDDDIFTSGESYRIGSTKWDDGNVYEIVRARQCFIDGGNAVATSSGVAIGHNVTPDLRLQGNESLPSHILDIGGKLSNFFGSASSENAFTFWQLDAGDDPFVGGNWKLMGRLKRSSTAGETDLAIRAVTGDALYTVKTGANDSGSVVGKRALEIDNS